MSLLATILLSAATKVGAPIVKGILEKHVGGTAGELGGVVIDAIAAKAGVPVEQLEAEQADAIEAAVAAVEAESPEIIAAWTESQREANRLMLAEMGKESAFGWMWRPAGMWLMLACIAWYVILRPLLNALLAAAGSAVSIEIGLDVGNFLGIFTIYTGLYMGGNTVIRSLRKGP